MANKNEKALLHKHTPYMKNTFLDLFQCQHRNQTKKLGLDIKKIKDRCHWIWSYAAGTCLHCLLMQSTHSKGYWITQGLLLCLILFTVLRAFMSLCYGETSMECRSLITWQYFTSTKTVLSVRGGEGKQVDEKWKYQDKWIQYCRKHFYQSQNCAKPSYIFFYSQRVSSHNKVF